MNSGGHGSVPKHSQGDCDHREWEELLLKSSLVEQTVETELESAVLELTVLKSKSAYLELESTVLELTMLESD
ncbi:hypothetical protein TorRG33x02_073830 [Trema orientale]|uniref:Uncharacterized protein n=1 Tax=Trema orientale TaxID=63057 RepID=A0A2P5FGT8_TREOI|nr:hypothetical protein TorRG33x02_073830 [Trema orientale]